MDMNQFSAKMTQLLEMEKNYSRIKSENLLFRQQKDDLQQQLADKDAQHRRELAAIFAGGVQKIPLAEKQINEWRGALDSMSEQIRDDDWTRMDNSNYTTPSYYTEERKRIDADSFHRYEIINAIMAALEKAAGFTEDKL